MSSGAIKGWRLRTAQFGLLGAIILIWHVFTDPDLLPPIYFDNADQAAFFLDDRWKWPAGCGIGLPVVRFIATWGSRYLKPSWPFSSARYLAWAWACGWP